MVHMFDIEKEKKIEYEARKAIAQKINRWQYFNSASFMHSLFTLIQKADPGNRVRLVIAFPLEVAVLGEWEYSIEKEFYKKYGIAAAN